jgi:hypothetical protein
VKRGREDGREGGRERGFAETVAVSFSLKPSRAVYSVSCVCRLACVLSHTPSVSPRLFFP